MVPAHSERTQISDVLTGVFFVLEGSPGPVAYFAETISFAEGLVGHVSELIRHFARTPSRGVVLNYGCHKLGHFTHLPVGHSHLNVNE